jgi:hypothetical protein
MQEKKSDLALPHEGIRSPVLETRRACPLCGKNDQVIKARTVNHLHPPLPPAQVFNSPPVLYEDPLRRQMPKLILFACLAGVMGILTGNPTFDAMSKSILREMYQPFLIPFIFVAGPLILFFILLADMIFIEIPRRNRQFLEDWMAFISNMQRARSEYQEKFQKWEKAMRLWGETYYCQKHNCVFTPLSGKFAPAEHLDDFLFQLSE